MAGVGVLRRRRRVHERIDDRDDTPRNEPREMMDKESD